MAGQSLELRHYYRAIAKRAWLVLVLAALLAGGMYWRTVTLPMRYEATATLLVTAPIVQPPVSAASGTQAQSASGGGRSGTGSIQDIINLLSMRPVAERVTGTLGLRAGQFQQGVRAEEVRGTNLIKVRASSTDPQISARLANTTTEQFIAYYRDVNRRDMREVRSFIERELANTRAQLDASDRSIQAFKERSGVLDLDGFVSQASQGLAGVRDDRQVAAVQLKEIEARLAASIARFNRESLTRITQRATESNPVFQQLESRLTALQLQYTELSQRYTRLHPRMQALEGEMRAVQDQMKAEARYRLGNEVTAINPVHDQMLTQIAGLQVDRAATAARLSALATVQGQRQAVLLPLAAQQRGLTALLRESQILTQSYSLLADRYQTARLRESEAGFMPAGVQVVEPATVPAAPVSAAVPVRVGLGGLVGLLLGLMAAVLLESTDDRIRSPQDAERTLGVPVLAEVPDMSPPPRVAPAGAALLIGLVLTLLVGTSVVVARTGGEGAATGTNAAMTALVQLGRGIDGLTAWLGHAVR